MRKRLTRSALPAQVSLALPRRSAFRHVGHPVPEVRIGPRFRDIPMVGLWRARRPSRRIRGVPGPEINVDRALLQPAARRHDGVLLQIVVGEVVQQAMDRLRVVRGVAHPLLRCASRSSPCCGPSNRPRAVALPFARLLLSERHLFVRHVLVHLLIPHSRLCGSADRFRRSNFSAAGFVAAIRSAGAMPQPPVPAWRTRPTTHPAPAGATHGHGRNGDSPEILSPAAPRAPEDEVERAATDREAIQAEIG